jgi:hypothetical protein
MDSSNLRAYTLMPTPNSTYLTCTKGCQTVREPMSGSTMGLLMLLSTFQYQAPYMSPIYSNAASQAGKAAYIQSGGQAMQDKVTSVVSAKAETVAKNAYHSVGITDTEVGAVLVTAKVIRDRQIDTNGPRIYFLKTHFTVGLDHGSVGLGINF